MARESYSRDEVRMSRAPSWDYSFPFCHHHPGLLMWSVQHHFFQAHPDLQTGGHQHSTFPCHTQPQSIRGEWFHRHPVRPLLHAVKHNIRSGVPWGLWATKLSSYRRPHRPLASHTTRQVHTHRVRTTARPQHRHQSLHFRCRACWPSNAGQAPCTEDSADSDGTQGSHPNMRRSHKRLSHSVVPVVSDAVSKLGSVDLACPPCSSSRLLAHNLMLCPTRDECDMHDMMSHPSDIIIKPSKHGTEFSSILASVFDFLLSSLVHFPLIPAHFLSFV